MCPRPGVGFSVPRRLEGAAPQQCGQRVRPFTRPSSHCACFACLLLDLSGWPLGGSVDSISLVLKEPVGEVNCLWHPSFVFVHLVLV